MKGGTIGEHLHLQLCSLHRKAIMVDYGIKIV